MKPKSTTATFAALLLSTFTASADTITWDGGGADNNWTTAANWGAGTQFDTLDSLIFAGSTRLTPNNDSVGSTVSGTNAIIFDAAAGAFTLGGNAITLGGNIGFSAAPAAPITQTINMNLIMSSGRTFSSSSGGNGTLVVNGDISESGGTNRALTKGQLGTLFLTGNNSFTGPLDIRAGAVSVNSIASSGSNSAIGAGSQISFGGPSGATANSTLTYTGTAAVTVNRAVLLSSSNANASGVIQNNSASGALTFTGTFTNSSTHTTGTKNFTLGGSNAGANDFQSVISNSTGGGITSFTKSGAGKWIVSGTNTYTGNTLANDGILQFSKQVSLYNNGVAAAWSNTNINVNSGATMAFNIGGGGEFTKANIITLLGLSNGDNGFKSGSILGLDTTSGNFTYDSVIADTNSGNNVLGLTKLGTNTLTLDQANTYTGATTVSGGKLAISGSGTIANSPRIQINSSTTLDVAGITGTTFTLGAAQTLTGGGTVLATGKTVLANGTIAAGSSPGTITQDGGTLQLGVGGDYNWEVLNASGVAGTGYDTVNLINGATLDLSLLSAGNTYHINLWSLSGIGPDVNGDAANFDNTLAYSWTLFSTGTAITGFSTDKFTIHTDASNGTSGFSNALGGGAFSIGLADSDTDLVLNFTPIPEPRTALLGTLGLLALLRRRR